jgi:hypothetical protein
VVCEVSDESHASIAEFLEAKGYRLIAQLGCNVVYERAESERGERT